MKKLAILTSHDRVISVNGFTLADLNQIFAFGLVESRVRPDAHMANILFGPYCLDESKNKERSECPWTKDDWGYMNNFQNCMEFIEKMVNKKNMFTIAEYYLVLFSDKTLWEVLAENRYFPEDLKK